MADTPGRRLRVVVVAQASPAQGGIATYAESIVGDPHLNRAIDMVLLNTTREATRSAGRLSPANVRNAVVDVVRVFRAGRGADVVHLQQAPGRVLPLIRCIALCGAARLGGAGVLCHVHSGRINGGQPEGFLPGWLFRQLLPLLGQCHAVLTVSHVGVRTLQPYLPGTRVECVDNAVPVSLFAAAKPAQEPAVVLFVGTLSERKGLRDLAEACALLRRDSTLPTWVLEVVGGANEVGEHESEQLREAFRTVGLHDSLVGPEDAEGVRRRLARASVFVLPSHWEGQPMVILEAMAAGLPVLSTTVGANPDVVRNGVDGLLVPPHDVAALHRALDRLIRDPKLREGLGASGRRRAREHHDMPVLAGRLAGLYSDAARQPQ